MRTFGILGYLAIAIIDTLYVLGRHLSVAVDFVADACVDVLRADYGNAVHIERWSLMPFRVIGLLKPEYDDSLHCDGQNFESRYRLAQNF